MKEELLNYIDLLDKISSKQFQRKVWIEGECRDRAESLGETINLLDDYKFFENIEKQKLFSNDSEKQKLLEVFSKEILNYNEPQFIELIYDDPKWLFIMKLADEIKNLLLKKEFILR